MITEKECTNLYYLLLKNSPGALTAALLATVLVLQENDLSETRNALVQLGLINPDDPRLS